MNFYTHNLSPIAFSLFEIDFPWYWLAYFFSYFLILFLSFSLIDTLKLNISKKRFQKFFFFGFFFMLVFSKLFYVLFYNPSFYFEEPLRILKIWEGGMSFHGALIGILCWLLIFTRKSKNQFWLLADIVATVAPIGIFLGRIANFINGELAGRVTTAPWAVVFPRLYDYNPRHPSQIYEALLEGLLLFVIMFSAKEYLRDRGRQTLRFLFFYALFRFICEFFREPDSQLGLIVSLSMGQIYCLLMMLASLMVFVRKA